LKSQYYDARSEKHQIKQSTKICPIGTLQYKQLPITLIKYLAPRLLEETNNISYEQKLK